MEPSGDITPKVLAALPKPDVTVDSAFPRLTYNHRSLSDAEVYFFFNESSKEELRVATVAGRGQVQVWDLTTGGIQPLSGATAAGDTTRFPLLLEPYEAKMIVVGPVPAGAAAPQPTLNVATPLLELTGEWALDLNGKQLTTTLKSWEELGVPAFSGPARYRKQFTAPAAAAGKRVFLELADVHDYARIKLNGKEMEARPWQPYRWDVANVLKPGNNVLEIEVNASPAARMSYGPRNGPPPVSGLLGPVLLVTR